ncbi:hypothetical protein HMN09_00198100 [Mycena chlorophos]|uniref:DUF7729 domain-containing protein n=1 Tax=Mycena chlorophos TaxID=658473 RepID=A0A8H6WJP3_MYCCL|nr:hypothetical protein HMN09_00198100 [Mycena chlorophos]
MITAALALIFAASAAAQSSSSATATATANPYIPTGISPSCSSFLNTLNTDTSLSECTSAIIKASSEFGPAGNFSNGASKTDVSNALGNICSTSTTSACPQSLITGKLANFYTECGPELISSPNAEVLTIYDTIYGFLPFLSSVCAKDDSGDWCVLNENTTTPSSAITTRSLYRRDDSEVAYMPNAATINKENLLFLLLNGSLPEAQLCTSCTRSVLSSYVTFESSTNYAPGLAQSVLMSGQSTLYNSVLSTCGSSFLSGAVSAAGGLGEGSSKGESGALSLRASGLLVSVGALGVAVTML